MCFSALKATRELIYRLGRRYADFYGDSLQGTAVWCLVSDGGSEVQYHIGTRICDHAEFIELITDRLC